jgi:predicted amidohydrolase
VSSLHAASFKAACVQLQSGGDVAQNIRAASSLIRQAATGGAQFIATPENTTLMAVDGGAKLASSFDEAHDPAIPAFAALAQELDVHLLIGSLAIKVSDTKTANRSLLFAPDGRVLARYSKIHLFDVDLTGGERYAESDTVAGGNQAVVAATPWGGLGLTICYDVRFPHLYRALAQKGVFAFTVGGNIGTSRNRSRCDLCRHRSGFVCAGACPAAQPEPRPRLRRTVAIGFSGLHPFGWLRHPHPCNRHTRRAILDS